MGATFGGRMSEQTMQSWDKNTPADVQPAYMDALNLAQTEKRLQREHAAAKMEHKIAYSRAANSLIGMLTFLFGVVLCLVGFAVYGWLGAGAASGAGFIVFILVHPRKAFTDFLTAMRVFEDTKAELQKKVAEVDEKQRLLDDRIKVVDVVEPAPLPTPDPQNLPKEQLA